MAFNNEIERVKAQLKVLEKKLALLEELEKTKSPVEEAYKDWWGVYPGTEIWTNFDETRWVGFKAGYEFAYAISTAKEVMEKVQEEQKEDIIEKLRKLEEKEPNMMLLRQGKVDIVEYNHRTHYRIEYTDSLSGVYKWFVRKLGEIPFLEEVRDVNVYASLEELYQKEVVKQKDDYPYKKYTPEETEQSLKEAFREAVKQGIIHEVDKVSDVFMNEMVEKLKGKTLYDVIADWWDDTFTNKETSLQELVDKIEEWLPKEQSAAGSQNVYVECSVEGYNDCLNKIKRKLR